ncbi:3-carboxy-cis,cis-muconate cycloisomerase [Acuticoccus kandeliae]|uniref:3-carboxy-cis,cis-muconate cycloisomerase n=1 Tax=Acuticoccus kandeliae TaxID=2073160 RepID=UPI000D3E77AB|nr:3-carboxy-cis,cis-muconate cycloisomerase [Acuticoccus kandeliae]
MAADLFEDALFGALVGDPAVASVFATERTIARYNAVEMALTRALAAEDAISADAAAAISATLETFSPDIATLRAATVEDGLPIPAYVRALREAVGPPFAEFVHLGATSQDIIDTALVLALRDVNDILAGRLGRVIDALDRLGGRYGANPMMARTRMQVALPITVGDRIKAWRAPLARHLTHLNGMGERLDVIQLGGPVGTRAGWNGRGDRIAGHMATALGLTDPGAAWHTARDGLGEYAGWLSNVSASLGKIGGDLCLMAQQGIETVAFAGGGSSSAMPHKQNPVRAELLVTLARYQAAQLGGFAQGLIHEQERSGAAWALEWLILPQMCVATGASLLTTQSLVGTVTRMGAQPASPDRGATDAEQALAHRP